MKNLTATDASSILHPATNADDFARNGSKIIESGQGIYLRDDAGKQLIDAVAGLWCVNVGYGREELAEAMQKAALAAELLSYVFGHVEPAPQIELAETAVRKSPQMA